MFVNRNIAGRDCLVVGHESKIMAVKAEKAKGLPHQGCATTKTTNFRRVSRTKKRKKRKKI